MLELSPLHPLFGVAVRGVELARPLDDATFAALREAFETHSLLVFPAQHLSDAEQVAFSERFGALEATKIGTPGAGSPLVILTNIAPDGSLLPPDHRQQRNHRANRLWHSDSSFKPVGALASVLSGREVPTQGGETEFVSTRAAWRDLPPALREQCEGRVVVHDFSHSRGQVDGELATDAERDALPAVRHPLVRINPVNGLPALFLGSHAAYLEGCAADAGRALLDRLLAFATAPERIYTHRWQPGDLLVWDNRCTLHRGRPWPATEQRRHMVRTTIAGVAPSTAEA